MEEDHIKDGENNSEYEPHIITTTTTDIVSHLKSVSCHPGI
jgi:hypothetical protein